MKRHLQLIKLCMSLQRQIFETFYRDEEERGRKRKVIQVKSEEEDYEWTQQTKEPKKKPRRKPRANLVWSCKKCIEEFNTRKQLQAHKKIHTRDDSPTTVALRNYKFDDVLDLFICNFCSAECQDEEEMKKHLSNNHLTKFDCNICLQSFTEPYKFSVHYQKHIGENFACPLCPYSTPRMTCIQSHINRMHLQKFIYNCKTCGKGFNDQAIFKEHDNEHLGIKPFTCVVCNKSYVFSKYLFAHQVRYHVVNIEGRLQNNQCGICMRIFAKYSTLEKHMKNRHENYGIPREKKLLCDICGQGFSRNDKLKIHYRIHTGIKPYACSYCPKSFIKKEYLVMHERVHNGERPYSCEYCGKCFNQSAPLRIHVRGHTGERPYICQICDQGFISRSSLNFHRKNYCTGRQDD
ncbi:hypothetical protein HHI36_018441 [Cryptolaemus montrouzieri]|uniref:C2H2-type domain-containing protein n=1 Tax=Cryptolaemus montrouzieri TaxID=559131 RepID=A0ABD2P056_9CUCU